MADGLEGEEREGWVHRVVTIVPLLAGLLLLALALPPQPAASAPGPTGWITGVVVDYADGTPVGEAIIERLGGPEVTWTAADGGFLLMLPAGRHHLRVSAPGYMLVEDVRALAPLNGGSEYQFAMLPEHPDEAMALRIAERWKQSERGTPPVLSAVEGDALQLNATRLGAPYRSLLPVVQLGCGTPFAAPGMAPTIRVLMPNGCVVAMDVEEYLKGVVPVEMPPTWSDEALKAQAVAARTYALGRAATGPGGAHVDTTTLTQGYGSRRFASTDRAVEATRGQVLTFEGKLAEVFYHSDSGGATESSENVWGGTPRPYLKGADDRTFTKAICERWAALCWSVTLTEPALRALLGAKSPLATTVISETYPSGRLKTLQVTTTDKKVTATTLLAEYWRRRLETKSGLVTAIGRQPDGTFKIVGRGWGHGLGMPQWGAWARAQEKQDYEQILRHYFPGTVLGPAPRP